VLGRTHTHGRKDDKCRNNFHHLQYEVLTGLIMQYNLDGVADAAFGLGFNCYIDTEMGLAPVNHRVRACYPVAPTVFSQHFDSGSKEAFVKGVN